MSDPSIETWSNYDAKTDSVLPSLVEERPEIGITVTVDPKHVFDCIAGEIRNSKVFMLMCPMEQRRSIISALTNVRATCESRGIKWIRNEIHFESHNNGHIHAHGIIEVEPKFYPYDSVLKVISKQVHNVVGRKGLRSNIACTTKWIDPKTRKDWSDYINKQGGDPLLAPAVIKDKHYKSIMEWLAN